ncbi:tyrosine-type recombinase/integrase [Noviherbaspirillum autotrophicum]|uniref:tyrosine-type recombinase/integrase n=1 Tax=Noviherbaspirillum autotrophicum TaxID=709839 RepID=UPI0006950172|nr:integrase arm-type DNA-binding domain-containing protein [Noviherbaspirillum autotrophicum]
MPLRDMDVRNAKASDKPRKLADERGLYLLINSAGKYWRFDYRFNGKRKTLALGTYPDVSLALAREKRDKARAALTRDIDPSEERKAQKAAKAGFVTNSFEAVAREWLVKFSPNWVASHASKIQLRLENDVFPWLGTRQIGEISAPDVLSCLRRIEQRGAVETAHRVLQNCGQIFRYAVATGRYLFPGARSSERPMSENTVNAALRRLDYGSDELTGHGFRSMASTLLNEQGWHHDAIERQLAHSERNSVRAAYNYAEHLPERRRMMQAWADYLDALAKNNASTPLKAAAA